MNKTKVLVIDDDPMMLDLATYQLQSHGYDVTTADTGEKGLKLIAEQRHEVALTDLRLPDINGVELVEKLKEVSPNSEMIMITGFGSMTGAIDAIKAGAFYFIEKPVEFEELFVLIEKAVERGRQREEIDQLRGRLSQRASYYNIIGSSRAMQNIYETIDSIAESDANVMIIGESGTGKELIANAIHYKSTRSKKPFVKINCSALPKELIESELFGHTKGAFTGATNEKVGLIGQATGGSLLLDEIGEMPIELQPKLLRVLQERVYYRVGSEKALEADFRLISSTNRSPMDAIHDGQLREDLYYRINTIEIQVPPLRERAEDVQHLAEYFLRMYAEKYNRQVNSISQQAYERMFEYSWPGNVRELQNVMERAVLLAKGEVIEEQAVPTPLSAKAAAAPAPETPTVIRPPAPSPPAPSPVAPARSPLVNVQEMTLEQLAQLIVTKMPNPSRGGPRVDIFTQLEGAIVRAALDRTRGNKQAAANLLGLYRPRLYSMLRKHNLHDTIREAEQNSLEDETDGPEIGGPEMPITTESDAARNEFTETKAAESDQPKESSAKFGVTNHDQKGLRAMKNAPFRY
jgi:DNA-binding NtrC family response regulator